MIWFNTFQNDWLTNNRTTKSSATMDNVGVEDIGLKYFDISSIIGCLGAAVMFASFYKVGNVSSSKEELIILAIIQLRYASKRHKTMPF